jgi:hypothetical protein
MLKVIRSKEASSIAKVTKSEPNERLSEQFKYEGSRHFKNK